MISKAASDFYKPKKRKIRKSELLHGLFTNLLFLKQFFFHEFCVTKHTTSVPVFYYLKKYTSGQKVQSF